MNQNDLPPQPNPELSVIPAPGSRWRNKRSKRTVKVSWASYSQVHYKYDAKAKGAKFLQSPYCSRESFLKLFSPIKSKAK